MPISKLAFARTSALLLVVGLVALLAIVATSLWLAQRTRLHADEIVAAGALRDAVTEALGLLVDAETGQRGFLLTGEAAYLEPYETSARRVAPALDALRRHLAQPSDERAMARLQEVAAAKLGELSQTIELARAGRPEAARAIVLSDRGKALMDEARALAAGLAAAAAARLDATTEAQHRSATALRLVTLAGGPAILLVVAAAAWAVTRYTRDLVAARAEVEALAAGLEERVRSRTADLERANEEIRRFAYIVSHDLRAPLVNVMGFTGELEAALEALRPAGAAPDAAPLSEAARTAIREDLPEALAFIRTSTAKMDGLINAILKLSREGQRLLTPEPVDLEAVLEAAAGSVRHRLAEAGGAALVECRAPGLVSDRLALEQIFGNLVDNAVKYRSPDRPPRIVLRTRPASAGRVIVEIEDNGRGIPAHDHERVFELFRRSGAQDQPGEGIGLAHVRALVRRLGGEIRLVSTPGRGSTFQVSLPRDLRPLLEKSPA